MLRMSYSKAQAAFASLFEQVSKKHEIVIIGRRGGSVAMISAGDLESLMETVYLVRSPKNGQRLLTALDRALRREGEAVSPKDLRTELGLEQ